MIRVSGLKEKLGREVVVSADGCSTEELLAEIRNRVSELVDRQMKCLRDDILPELAREGIIVNTHESLAAAEQQELYEYFRSSIYPLLTPQAVDPSHPFPYISGGSLNIGLFVQPTLIPRVSQALGNSFAFGP